MNQEKQFCSSDPESSNASSCDEDDDDDNDNGNTNENENEEWVDNDEDFDDDDTADIQIIDLFSSNIFHSLTDYLSYCQESHQINLISLANSLGGDEIACILMINFIRTLIKESNQTITVEEIIQQVLTKEFLQNERYMFSVLPNDQLLYLLGESVNEYDPEEQKDEEWEKSQNYSFLQNVTAVPEPTSNITKEELLDDKNDTGLTGDYYFDGYSHIGIHETMLRDVSRTQAYANALLSNSSLLEGKIVLDVGCGTGILSMLAARAGAKKVIGVDMSSILKISQKVIERNGYGDRIHLVRGRIEEIELPLEGDEQIDIIVSEWMGYGLYFENMLPAVMYARDKYLRKGENNVVFPWSIMPSHASLFVEVISTEDFQVEDRVGWWRDVYGFDMSDMIDLFLPEAQVDVVSNQLVVSNRSLFHELSILTAQSSDLDFSRSFQLTITKDSVISAFVISFDVLFSPGSDSISPTILSTGTAAEPTHWKQTVLWLHPSHRVVGSRDDQIIGTIEYQRSDQNDRDYEITLSWRIERGGAKSEGGDGGGSTSVDSSVLEFKTQKYILGAS